MAVRLVTQAAMDDRRRELRKCYICAAPLPPSGPGWRAQVIAEHVLPKSLLGPLPPNQADRWPVKLFVHQECEERHKRRRDELVRLLHAMADPSNQPWSIEDARMFTREFDVAPHDRPGHEPAYGISGIGDCIQAAALWSRGMHAALYGSVLPNMLGVVIHPPVPVWHGDQNIEEGLRHDELREYHLLGLLRVANHAQRVDEVRAWGGAVVYQCVWREAMLRHDGRWGCAWALEFPASRAWAKNVRGIDRPWHGYFELNELPAGASLVGKAEIDEFNRFVETQKRSTAYRALHPWPCSTLRPEPRRRH